MTTAARPLVHAPGRRMQHTGDDAPLHGSSAMRHPGARYSRFVQLLKLMSAAVALILLAAVIVWPQLRPRDGTFQIGVSESGGPEDAESLNMVNPRYTGLDSNNLPYEVTADLASQETSKSEFITLDNPKADMTMKDGSWLALTARSGLYGQKSQKLELSGDVNLFHDSGYEFTSRSATIDLDSGTGEGKEPAYGHGPAGEIEGEGFRFTDKGKIITFTGKSHLILYPIRDDVASGKTTQGGPTSEKRP